MSRSKSTGLALLGVVLVLAFSCIYFVNEGQRALILRLGKLTLNSKTGEPKVFGPGIHCKIPLINQVKIFDTRLQTLDIKSARIVTQEKKDFIVEYYVKWKIQKVALYFKATSGNEFQAQTLLEQNLNTALRAEFGKRTMSDIITGERGDLMSILKTRAAQSAASLGIEIQDVRIKSIDLPANASTFVYNKMRAEMQKNANKHRADGKAAAEETQAVADAKVTVILAKATSLAQVTRAKGKATAAQIYTDAYSKDPQFFAFYRSLKAYRHAFGRKDNILVLRPDSKFFEYFNQYELGKHGAE